MGISTKDVVSMKELKSDNAAEFLMVEPCFSALYLMQLKSPIMIQGPLGCRLIRSDQSCLRALVSFALYAAVSKKSGLEGDEALKWISWLVSIMGVRVTLFQF